MKEAQPVPRTRVPELRKTTLTIPQLDNLHNWDIYIETIKVEKPMPLKERWQQLDREFIARRNKEIGWKPKK